MIFYFSGTGNSRWVATQLAAKTRDQAQDIATLKAVPALQQETQIGLVFPIYAWGAPEPVCAFAKTLPKTEAFTFAVCTCGEEAGYAMKKLAEIWPLRSCYSLVMPNNYILGADVDDEQTALRKIQKAEAEIRVLSEEILERKPVYRVQEGAMAAFKSGIVHFGFNRFARNTRAFYATDACNGCGLCAQSCPAGTITLSDGKPVWGKLCYQCLRCIHSCPQRAIQYGKSTENRGRYTLDRYLKNIGQ